MARRLGTAVAVAVFVIGAALAVTEVGLRAARFSAPVWYQPDPQLGWTLRPGARGWYTEEGRGYVWISPAGFRDRSHALLKPHGVYRIAVLGGAYAEAMPVSFNDTFWWRLEDGLQKCAQAAGGPAGRKIEVMNFGVGGYGAAQDYALLESVASRYQPDLVLLAFSGAEDLPLSSPRLAGARRGPFAGREPAAWEALAWQAADRSRAVQLANLGWERFRSWRDSAAGAQAAAPQAGLPAEDAAFAPPRNDEWRGAWSATERLLGKMNAFASSHGARFAVMLVTHPAQVSPDAAARRNLQDALGVQDLFYAERRIGELGRREGFQVIALAPQMQRQADETSSYFHGFRNARPAAGPWNEKGHKAAAEILARSLCAAPESGFIR